VGQVGQVGKVGWSRGLRAGVVAALLFQAPSPGISEHPRLANLPRLMLWAWERPEDLRRLDGSTGVAFLSQTIVIAPGQITIQPRRQPLHVGASTLMAVTRVETGRRFDIADAGSRTDDVVTAIARTAALPRVTAVQVDFDARASERQWYSAMLHKLRSHLGPAVPISITALASWCIDDHWLADLPIDEAVPMMFRLGPVNAPYARIATSGRFAAPECRGALGLSLDEATAFHAGRRRLYVFNPRSWTDDAVAAARQGAMQ
jgi:hypothetical protein